MATGVVRKELSENEILGEVRWRFRICNYLFRLGTAWMVVGWLLFLLLGGLSHEGASEVNTIPLCIELVGWGIFSAAFALTLAIYRCPVCDKYLSRFRPQIAYCPSCGAMVREKTAKRWSWF